MTDKKGMTFWDFAEKNKYWFFGFIGLLFISFLCLLFKGKNIQYGDFKIGTPTDTVKIAVASKPDTIVKEIPKEVIKIVKEPVYIEKEKDNNKVVNNDKVKTQIISDNNKGTIVGEVKGDLNIGRTNRKLDQVSKTIIKNLITEEQIKLNCGKECSIIIEFHTSSIDGEEFSLEVKEYLNSLGYHNTKFQEQSGSGYSKTFTTSSLPNDKRESMRKNIWLWIPKK